MDRRNVLAGLIAGIVATPWPARGFDLDRMKSDDGTSVRSTTLSAVFNPALLPAPATLNDTRGITLYEFIDYNCGYCRNAAPALAGLTAQHTDLRLTVLQHPVLGRGSTEAARLCLSTALEYGPHKAFALHQRLLDHKGRVDGRVALDHARLLGCNVAQLEKLAAGPAVSAALEQHTGAARQLGLKSVPSFIMANLAFIGWPGPGTISQLAADIRQCGQPFCRS